MIGAGLLAKKAVEKGLSVPPWVKTSLAPGSKVVTDYLEKAGLMPYLEKLKFHIVGYGCTTCIGNSGPLPAEVSKAIDEKDLVVASVLSGNRNFEGRINSEVRANYLMSPPLVVAFALAGRIDIDLRKDAARQRQRRQARLPRRHLAHAAEVEEAIAAVPSPPKCSARATPRFSRATSAGAACPFPKARPTPGKKIPPTSASAPYFDDMTLKPSPVEDITGARVLAVLGDSVTTDHISPAGSIKKDGPAGKYLLEHGVQARRLQLLRLAPRQSRSHGARHLRQRPPAQQTGHDRRRIHPPSAPKRGNVDLRRLREISGRRHSARHSRRQRIRLRLLARLGSQGTAPARRATPSSPKATNAFTARIWSAWEFCRCSSCRDRTAESLKLTGEETFEITGIRDVVEHFAAGQQVKVRAARQADKPSSSKPWSASTRRRKRSTTPTAGFCSMCCGSCWRRNRSRWECRSRRTRDAPGWALVFWVWPGAPPFVL